MRSTARSLHIDGIDYLPQQRVLELLGVSRQTLWRWRKDGCIPVGYLHPRTNQLLFTPSEFEAIREYADRLEPSAPSPLRGQISLFATTRSKGSP